MDVFTKKKRSEMMSLVKTRDTKFEILVRQVLFKRGYRFRKNVKTLPGSPDIVLKKFNTVIFINGCFWHGHEPCPLFKWPKSRKEFWEKKILGNRERDFSVQQILKSEGWKVVVLWECNLRKNFELQIKKLEKIIQK